MGKMKDSALIIAVLCIAGAALWYVQAYSRNTEPTSFRNFFVSGDGKSLAIPDIAKFTASVITEGGKDVASSQQKNTDKVNGVIAFVKESGIEAKDIATQNYSVNPRYQYFDCSQPIVTPQASSAPQPCPPPEIVGYTIEQTIAVKIRENKFGKIGDLLSGVVTKGANSVSQLSFEVDDPTVIQDEARAKAIEKAKNKAEGMARAGGFSLGRLLSIEEGSSPQPYYGGQYFSAPAATAAMKAAPPTIEPGSQEVTATVTLKYEIK